MKNTVKYITAVPIFTLGFPHGSDGKESTCSAVDLGSIPGLGRSPGGGHDNPKLIKIVNVCLFVTVRAQGVLYMAFFSFQC